MESWKWRLCISVHRLCYSEVVLVSIVYNLLFLLLFFFPIITFGCRKNKSQARVRVLKRKRFEKLIRSYNTGLRLTIHCCRRRYDVSLTQEFSLSGFGYCTSHAHEACSWRVIVTCFTSYLSRHWMVYVAQKAEPVNTIVIKCCKALINK